MDLQQFHGLLLFVSIFSIHLIHLIKNTGSAQAGGKSIFTVLSISFYLTGIIFLFGFPLSTLLTGCGISWNKQSSLAGGRGYISRRVLSYYVPLAGAPNQP
jgi:hypothetical protein